MYSIEYKQKVNNDIAKFISHLKSKGEDLPHLFEITEDMHIEREGVSKLVMLDRYAFKDIEKVTLEVGDFVVLTVKEDTKWPTRGFGYVNSIDWNNNTLVVKVDEEFVGVLEGEEAETGLVTKNLDSIEKPLELYYEQIAKRNASGLASVEPNEIKKDESFKKFYKELSEGNFVPAGRVLYGAGSATDVTYFNCYVMPYPKDSREGLADHRKEVMEIMSRGGGVGTNGSSLRPKNTLARGVNGKSSGSVSWLDDIAKLTHLVEQGGSRRGAQMIMLADWHPDIIEFIISKMQNPNVLRFIIDSTNDEQIRQIAKNKLKFTPLTEIERQMLTMTASYSKRLNNIYPGDVDNSLTEEELKAKNEAIKKLNDGGTYSVNDPDFLTGANISVALTHEFMNAIENDEEYALRFPDTESYNKEQMEAYNNEWHEYGDVRQWEELGYKIRTYRTIKAKELWNLINIAATYSAEPGIFFIDNANDMTNAKAYGQQVVCTNPCGEQPLAPYSVCNLAAVNLANMYNKETKTVDWDKLINTVKVGIRMQDNVIDATPYFLDKNTKQALAERRIGLGVMGLHDLLLYCELEYGSEKGNELVDNIFLIISVAAYEESIELAKEKGSFPLLQGENNNYDDVVKLRNAFINTGYMKTMPEHIRQDILKYGIRNSHLLTIAPTGSTGTMMNVSTGLEPYFSFSYFRSGRLGKFIEVKADIAQEWLDANPNETELPNWFISSMELTPEAHADVQCIIQKRIDSSISKTVNAPKGYTVEQVEKVYERLWKGGAKGGTVYVDGSRDAQVLSLTNEENVIEDVTFTYKDNETNEVNEDNVGINPGDTCPACRKGIIELIAGCSTCTNCQSQLKCDI